MITARFLWFTFTLEQCSNCRMYRRASLVQPVPNLDGRYCPGCGEDLMQQLRPEDMGFEEHHDGESICEGRETGRAQLRGATRASGACVLTGPSEGGTGGPREGARGNGGGPVRPARTFLPPRAGQFPDTQ